MIGFWIFISVILLVGSLYDVKYFAMPVWLLVMGGVGAFLASLYGLLPGKETLFEILLGFLPGAIALLLAYVTREQIGYGDGVLLLILGGCVGIEKTIWIMFAALLGSFVISAFLLLSGRAGRNRRLPFVPFLLGGNMVVMLGSLSVI